MTVVTVFGWLVLIFCERKILLAGWCWFYVREKYCWLDAAKMKQTETKRVINFSLCYFNDACLDMVFRW